MKNFLRTVAAVVLLALAPVMAQVPQNIAIARFGNGSAAIPSASFTNSTGLGLYRIADNVMGIAAGGAGIGYWSATGLTIGGVTGNLSKLTVIDTGTSLPRGISNLQISTGTDSANFSGYKARGVLGTETTIVTGDLLTNLRAWGYDGTAYINSGSLRWTSEGTIATSRVPSKAELLVSTDASPSVLTATASFSGSSGIVLTALGSGQNLTFTPGTAGYANVTGSTNGVRMGRLATSTTFGAITFNGSFSDTANQGIYGGGDSNLYVNVATGGQINFRVNGSNVVTINGSGGLSTGAATFTGNFVAGASGNGDASIKSQNLTSGTTATAGFFTAPTGVNNAYLIHMSGGFTTAGKYVAGGLYLENTNAAGVFVSSTNGPAYVYTNNTLAATFSTAQNVTFAGSVTTSAPTTGTAGAWKMGIFRTSTLVALDSANWVELDIGGTLRRLALITITTP